MFSQKIQVGIVITVFYALNLQHYDQMFLNLITKEKDYRPCNSNIKILYIFK